MPPSPVEERLDAILPDLVSIRRHLHQNPERRYEEFETADLVQRELAACGVEVGRIGETGVVGLLRGAGRGKTVAFRADMDALPIQEQTGLPYASTNGLMHACGHDGHTAVLLGAARVLSTIRDGFSGNVKFIFQPAEEGGLGAKAMCDAGVMSDPVVDAVFGLHGWPEVPLGAIATRPGAMMGGQSRLSITVRGRGAHGAHPHESVAPIFIAAKVIDGLQGVVSRQTCPHTPAVVTIGSIHGGAAGNIIPDEVRMRGTVRYLDAATYDAIVASVTRIVTHTAEAFSGEAEATFSGPVPPVLNDEAMTALVMELGGRTLGREGVILLARSEIGAEDFSLYLQHAPGALFFLGLKEEGRPDAPIHTATFDFNDKAIPYGVTMFVNLARELLGR